MRIFWLEINKTSLHIYREKLCYYIYFFRFVLYRKTHYTEPADDQPFRYRKVRLYFVVICTNFPRFSSVVLTYVHLYSSCILNGALLSIHEEYEYGWISVHFLSTLVHLNSVKNTVYFNNTVPSIQVYSECICKDT